jgi:Xaa-Pro aminopeptidase
MDLIKQKINQAFSILDELDTDLWLIFVRETPMMADPVLQLVVGEDPTWQSLFAFSRREDAIALVGNFDAELFSRSGRFSEVLTFVQDPKDQFRQIIERLDPRQIAINYSLDNPAADGLTHGMFTLLQQYLDGTPYIDRFISAGDIISRLRSRKLPVEVDRIARAAELTCKVWDESIPDIKPGMSEVEIAAIIDSRMAGHGATNSFHTIVNAGDKSVPGHGRPSEAKLESGDLLHVDFGIQLDDYCSDLQRLIYFMKPGESSPPESLMKAFNLVRDIITESAVACRPGKAGWEIDSIARKMLVENGYPEYQHALGHQLGRGAHDGGAVLGPQWERYGDTPNIPLEIGNAFTLELEIMLPEIGCVGLEEDVVLEESGAKFLCPRQQELTVS